MKIILESEFKIRVLDNPLSPLIQIYVYDTDEGYTLQFVHDSADGKEIRTLATTRGDIKRFQSLDTVYKNIVLKYGCPVIIEPSFQLT